MRFFLVKEGSTIAVIVDGAGGGWVGTFRQCGEVGVRITVAITSSNVIHAITGWGSVARKGRGGAIGSEMKGRVCGAISRPRAWDSDQ